MNREMRELKGRLSEIHDLESAAALLQWDQATYMPPGGGPARARQLGTLRRLAHEKFTDPAVGALLERLAPQASGLPYDSDEASLIRVVRRDYERAVRIPAEFMARFQAHQAESYEAWARARPANDFAAVRPCLEKTLELSLELAGFFPGGAHPADALIDFVDPDTTVAVARALFADLRARLVPLVRAIASQPPADDACLRQSFPESDQLRFGTEVAGRFGYDFERGRIDKTRHPFMTSFSIGDVRITMRAREDDLGDALFSILHETGHALYGQGARRELEELPLAEGTSSGVHESQSRLWENVVGRSRAFWSFFYPRLQEVFPAQLGNVPREAFYRAINKVEPSLIRTDADEVTYNLHVMMRFDFELALLEGRLAVRDLPEAWRERVRADFGIAPADDRDGVLQDVHWYAGQIGGMFQGYTLGNILSAQFFQAALRAHPRIPEEIAQGVFSTLHGWLIENIYQHGRKYRPAELIERATGSPLTIEPYLGYLRGKYSGLYDLALGAPARAE